jgi:hypothetical protein
MEETTVFRKSTKGTEEMAGRLHGLAQKLRRALIIIDGSKDIAELSVLMRPGEAEAAFEQLFADGYIEIVSDTELNPARIAYVPAANDPAVFAMIKHNTMTEVTQRLGAFSEMVNAEISSCNSALDLRLMLRDIEDVLVDALGQEEGVQLARKIGSELTRLVPRSS